MSGSRTAFAIDDVVGGYHLVRRAGKGGMAEVWLARKGGRGRPVALKLILPHLAGEARYSRMFRTEAEVSGLMNHSNIAQCFDEGEDAGVSYLVMEWVEGINLVRLREALKLIDNVELRHTMIAFVVGQLLHALAYAHALADPAGNPLGIIHRDISPQNVLVSAAGDVKLLDFGVAHTLLEESSGMHVKGKLRYMAPEQLTTRDKAPTLDLFGVGALLHELLDGSRFRGDFKDDRQLHAQVIRGLVPTPQHAAPPELEHLRRTLLAAAPSTRPQSATEALALLHRFAGYRDCRVELSKVVGSLLGSARPRSAVEPSSAARDAQPPAAAPSAVAPLVAHPPAAQPDAPAPAKTMFLEGGGLPPGAAAPEATEFLPNPNAPGGAPPVQEPTAFLSPPSVAQPAPPPTDVDEGTAFVAPPVPHGPAHPPRRASTPHAPSQQASAPNISPPLPMANEPSMTRFVVQQRSTTRTVAFFLVGLLFALSAAGAVAYVLLKPEPESPNLRGSE